MTTREEASYHESFWGRSAEYTLTVTRYGRKLTPERVESILAAHSFTVADLVEDTHDPILGGATELPERLDAAMLYAWLGY